MSETQTEIESVAERLDAAQGGIAQLDPLPRQLINDHITAIDELHALALKTIVRKLREDPSGKEILFELVDDPAVHMVLAMHGIIRSQDPRVLAEAALDAIRPGIAAHGGDVQLARIEDGVAYVHLMGACNGCSMAAVTMREGVEKALLEAVPVLTAVEVVPNEPGGQAAQQPLLQITTVGAPVEAATPGSGGIALPMVGASVGGAPAGAAQTPAAGNGAVDAMAQSGWYKTFPVERIAVGTLEAMSLQPAGAESVEVIVVNARGQMAAYVNACAHQGMPLDNALVDADQGTLTCPWHGFCFDSTTGECLTAPGAQLEQLPLRIEDGHVWVRSAN